MEFTALKNIKLESLSNGIPAIHPEAAGFYIHNCMVCFDSQGHSSGVQLVVESDVDDEISRHSFNILWSASVTERIRRAYGDLLRATDNGACAIALLIIREITEYTAIEQSSIGTTIDYFLAPRSQDDTLIFNHAARLEVSGILAENSQNSVTTRVKSKIKRLDQESRLPAFIIVVEFSKPWSRVVKI